MARILFDSPENAGEEQLQADLRLLPSWRRVKAESYVRLSDRIQCAKAFLLLKRALQEDYGMEEVPEFVYGPFGKPQLKGHPEIHFSLSHCRTGVMCAVDSLPVGCDIEAVPPQADEEVMLAAFREEEREAVRTSVRPEIEYARIWTAKEAFLKMEGTGISTDLKDLPPFAETGGTEFIRGVGEGETYVWTVCRRLQA